MPLSCSFLEIIFCYLSCHNTSQSAAAIVSQHYCTTAVTHSDIRVALSVLLVEEPNHSFKFTFISPLF